MRKILTALALVASVFSAPAAAADWVLVFRATSADHFVDRTSIRQVGSYKQAWDKIEGEGEENVILTEYDCTGRRSRFMQITIYYRNGKIESVPGDRTWRYATPDTAGEAKLEYVCFGRLPD